MLRCKVAVVGDAKCGKTTLLQSLTKAQNVSKTYSMTQLSELHQKTVKIPDTELVVELFLLELSGHSIYQTVQKPLTTDACTVIVVFDQTSRESFNNVKRYLDDFKEVANSSFQFSGVLVANKTDLPELAQVTHEQAIQLAHDLRMAYFEVSAVSHCSFFTSSLTSSCSGHIKGYRRSFQLYCDAIRSSIPATNPAN